MRSVYHCNKCGHEVIENFMGSEFAASCKKPYCSICNYPMTFKEAIKENDSNIYNHAKNISFFYLLTKLFSNNENKYQSSTPNENFKDKKNYLVIIFSILFLIAGISSFIDNEIMFGLGCLSLSLFFIIKINKWIKILLIVFTLVLMGNLI